LFTLDYLTLIAKQSSIVNIKVAIYYYKHVVTAMRTGVTVMRLRVTVMRLRDLKQAPGSFTEATPSLSDR